jgi:hypothetical protein
MSKNKNSRLPVAERVNYEFVVSSNTTDEF